MKPIKLTINTDTQTYPIIIGSNLISKFNFFLKKNSISFEKCLVVVDKNISKKKLNILKKSINKKKIFFHFIEANEKNKNQTTTMKIVDVLLKKNFSRLDCLIAVGGGITGDVSGFAASIFKRGLQLINFPTTLLSQVDSSIGGKTGVNTKYGKNLIGSFYQPKLVISDIDFLETLPKREIACGYAEILKHSIIANKYFYNFLNSNVLNIINLKSPFIEKAIFESCKIKKKVVEKDEKEKNFRKVLNFGHTFAHAFEATTGYTKKLNHGEAVLLGINAALKFSLLNNLINNKDYYSILEHFAKSDLPYNLKDYFKLKDLNKILFFMTKDKKNNSKKINLILLKRIGSPIIHNHYNVNDIKSFLKKELFY